ncbi:DUF1028 domain-containing protein [Devosia sp. 2618]|uniref:DUF1028 domain-containing protein n=1 Tax=Devosia sp. 2618 TaxID=3156454 RepID=UPI003398F878
MTYSIVARDPKTGALGVATATAGPAVGALVPHVRAGIGAVATQAMTNPYLAFDGLEKLGSMAAKSAMAAALAVDAEHDRRQVIMIDRYGETAAWTGSLCDGFAGHLQGVDVAVAGNLLTGPTVLQAMMEAFRGEDLGERLLAALVAGEAAGGDRRGTSSAALKVYSNQQFADVDLRVDWSARPLPALAELMEKTLSGGYADFFADVTRR